MKVSLIQMNSVADKVQNVADAERLARQAVAQDGEELVVFPEHFDWAGGSVADKVAAGEGVRGGPAYDMCRRLARECGIHVHSGSFYETAPGLSRVYNTTVVFNPQGEEIGRYGKIHLFDIHTRSLWPPTRCFDHETGKDHWEVLCRARAIETQCYFMAAAQIGAFEQDGEKRYTYGHSLVCDPWGHVIARASDQVGIVSSKLDRTLIIKTRKHAA